MAAQVDNNLLLKEIKAIHSILDDHENRIRDIEQYKIATMAAEAAIAKYKQENPARPTVFGSEGGINKDFVNVVLKFLAVVGGLVGIITLILKYWLV